MSDVEWFKLKGMATPVKRSRVVPDLAREIAEHQEFYQPVHEAFEKGDAYFEAYYEWAKQLGGQ